MMRSRRRSEMWYVRVSRALHSSHQSASPSFCATKRTMSWRSPSRYLINRSHSWWQTSVTMTDAAYG